MKLRGSTIFAAIIYLGIGLLFHSLLIGDTVNWESAYSLATIFGWPFICLLALIAVCLAVCVLVLIWMLCDEAYSNYKIKQQVKLNAAKLEENQRIFDFLKYDQVYYVTAPIEAQYKEDVVILVPGRKLTPIRLVRLQRGSDEEFYFSSLDTTSDGTTIDPNVVFVINRKDILTKLDTIPPGWVKLDNSPPAPNKK